MAVYLVRNQGFYKIGYSNDPYKRMAELQIGNPTPIELVGTISGSITDERRFHDLFKEKRVSGEWFSLSDEDVQVFLSSSPNLLLPVKPEPAKKSPPVKIMDPVPAFVRRPSLTVRRYKYEGMAPDGGDLYLSPREADYLLEYMRKVIEEHEQNKQELRLIEQRIERLG